MRIIFVGLLYKKRALYLKQLYLAGSSTSTVGLWPLFKMKLSLVCMLLTLFQGTFVLAACIPCKRIYIQDMEVHRYYIFFLIFNLKTGQAQIVKGPTTQTVISGETAIFNCSMDCNNQSPVTWYFTLPTNSRTGFVSSFTNLAIIKTIYGIEVSRRTLNECPQGGYIVEQFFVTSSRQLNLMPVQCSTVSDSGCGPKMYVYFSITALLNVPGQ